MQFVSNKKTKGKKETTFWIAEAGEQMFSMKQLIDIKIRAFTKSVPHNKIYDKIVQKFNLCICIVSKVWSSLLLSFK